MQITRNKIIIVSTGILILLIATFAPYGIVQQTSKPAFCNICHVMKTEYEAWFLTGVHRSIKCVDCHLPNNNAINHLIWKGLDGMKDVISFFNGIYPEYISATGHAKKVIQKNCIRCHGEMVSRINIQTVNCWFCHRRISHKLNEFGYSDNR